jgi:hypothetical protein
VLRHPVYHLGWGKNFSTPRSSARCAPRAEGHDLRRARHGALDGSHQECADRSPATVFSRIRGFKPSLDLELRVASFADWMRKHEVEWK